MIDKRKRDDKERKERRTEEREKKGKKKEKGERRGREEIIINWSAPPPLLPLSAATQECVGSSQILRELRFRNRKPLKIWSPPITTPTTITAGTENGQKCDRGNSISGGNSLGPSG